MGSFPETYNDPKLGFGIRKECWNRESRNPESIAWIPGSKSVLDSLKWGEIRANIVKDKVFTPGWTRGHLLYGLCPGGTV